MAKIIPFRGKFSLPPKYESVLRDQIIDEERPGPILRDFGNLLDFIGAEGISIRSGKRGFFPNKVIEELNARMTHPMKHDVKRPRQVAFPYLQGLYLLLRSSGLGVLEGKGAKRRIALVETLLAGWRSLNLVERYFNALEAWLMRGHPDIISERGHLWSSHVNGCARFLFELPRGGLDLGEKGRDLWAVRYGPGFYNLALMDLFGLVTVEQGTPEPGQGWRIKTIRRTPFGEALLGCLSPIGAGIRLAMQMALQDEEAIAHTDEEEPGETGGEEADGEAPDPLWLLDEPEGALERWQALMQPFFPEWQNNLAAKVAAFRDGTYILKVSLGDTWRRFAMAGSMDLDYLCCAILDSVDFDYDHLYAFYYKDKLGVTHEATAPEAGDDPSTDDVRVGEMELEPGDSFKFLYDFGDNWEFEVKLERIDPVGKPMKRPEMIESHGEAPRQYPAWDEEDDDWDDDDENDDSEDDEDLDEEADTSDV